MPNEFVFSTSIIHTGVKALFLDGLRFRFLINESNFFSRFPFTMRIETLLKLRSPETQLFIN